MAKDVNIHVKTPGADQARQTFESVSYSVDQFGNTVAESTGKARRGTDLLEESTERTRRKSGELGSTLGSLVGRYASYTAAIAAATGAIREQMAALEEHGRIAKEQQTSLLALQYLGDLFAEKPELRKEVAAYAEFGRRPFDEVARAWYDLRSKAAALPTEQQEQILRESLELGRTAPEVSLGVIVDMFSLYAKKTGEIDANVVQNILQQTITEAGGTAADVAGYMPRTLPLGLAAGLTGPETAGLWAFASTQAKEASIATTGLNTILYALAGRGTPQQAEILKQLGVRPGMDFFRQMEVLASAQRRGALGLPEAETIAGREGASMLLDILAQQGAMRQTIANVVEVARPDLDITAAKIEGLMGTDEAARRAEEVRRLEIAVENIKGEDVEALKLQELYRRREMYLREEDVPEAILKLNLWATKIMGALGFSAESLEGAERYTGRETNIQIGDVYNTVEQPSGDVRTPNAFK